MWIFLVILILIIVIFNATIIEKFNNRESRLALYDHPDECPFEYIRLYEDSERNNKFILESKLKGKPKSLDIVFDSIDAYNDSWNQLSHVFPNINKCGNPYETYLKNVRQYYQDQKYAPRTHETTTPIYNKESFSGTMKIDIPTSRNIDVRGLTRTTDNPTQLATNRYMTPNTPITHGNEQIDTSVQPHNDMIPITYTDKNIQLLKNQMVDSEYDAQRAQQRMTLQMNSEIEQLRLEIEVLRQQLVNEKRYFEDLDRSVEEKQLAILRANDTTKKIEDIEMKICNTS
jgi:hypothetical protein